MARVTRSDPMPGWRTCQRPRIYDPEHGPNGARDEDCPSYESQPCEIVKETVEWTFHDDKSDGVAGMDHNAISRSTERYLPADGNWECPDCGHPMSDFNVIPRPTYRHLSDSHPDELRRRTLRQDKQAETQLSLQERQTAALEALAAQGQEARRITELEAQLAALTARLSHADGEDEESPAETRPARQKARS